MARTTSQPSPVSAENFDIPEPELPCPCGSEASYTRPSGTRICPECGRPKPLPAKKLPRP